MYLSEHLKDLFFFVRILLLISATRQKKASFRGFPPGGESWWAARSAGNTLLGQSLLGRFINPFLTSRQGLTLFSIFCTDWLASQSDLIDMTYKVVHMKAMNVGFRFLEKQIQNSIGFVTDVQFKMKRFFWSVGSRATGGYENVTYLNIFLLKNKSNIHAVILNHFIGPYDFFDSLTRESVTYILSYWFIFIWLTDSRVSESVRIVMTY